jgi:hypothetical protein
VLQHGDEVRCLSAAFLVLFAPGLLCCHWRVEWPPSCVLLAVGPIRWPDGCSTLRRAD